MIDFSLIKSTGERIAHAPAEGVSFDTSNRGSGSAFAFIPASLLESFDIYNTSGLITCVIRDGGKPIWRGRAENVGIVNGGVEIEAVGFSSAFSDVLYTALWSKTSTSDFIELDATVIAGRVPSKFRTSKERSIFVGLEKNAVYASGDIGDMAAYSPNGGERKITNVSFDYKCLAATGWRGRLFAFNESGASVVTEWDLTANGTLLSGTQSITLSAAKDAVSFGLQNVSAGSLTYSGETGGEYLEITNIRIKTTTAATVLASDIAGALADYVDGINDGQINGKLITATTADLLDELYEDQSPAEILDDLAARHAYAWGVDENGFFFFKPRSDTGNAYTVDVTEFTLERAMPQMYNEVYATYKGADGRVLRTASSSDTDLISDFGITRHKHVSSSTTGSTQATAQRDTALEDAGNYVARMDMRFSRVMLGQDDWPLAQVMAGDVITIRNLPAISGVGNLVTFRIARTSYDVDTGILSIEPELPLPTLITMIGERQQSNSITGARQ